MIGPRQKPYEGTILIAEHDGAASSLLADLCSHSANTISIRPLVEAVSQIAQLKGGKRDLRANMQRSEREAIGTAVVSTATATEEL